MRNSCYDRENDIIRGEFHGRNHCGAFDEHALHNRGCWNSDPARHFVADQEAEAHVFVWSGRRTAVFRSGLRDFLFGLGHAAGCGSGSRLIPVLAEYELWIYQLCMDMDVAEPGPIF